MVEMEVGQDFRLGFLLKASLPGVARNCSQQFLDRSVSVFSARCNFTSLQPVRIPSLEMKNAPPKGVAFFMARELGFPPRLSAESLVARGCEKLLPAVSRSLGFSFLCRENFTSFQPVRIPSLEMKNAPPKGVAFFMARELGFEPRTDRLHIILIFRIGVDYIIIPLGCEALRQLSLLLADSL